MAKKTSGPEEPGRILGEAAPALEKPIEAAELTAPAKGKGKEPGKAEIWCYIGPSLPGLIQHGAIFRGSRADALREAAPAIEKQPLVKTLLVSGDTLPLDRLKAKTPGTALYDICRKAVRI